MLSESRDLVSRSEYDILGNVVKAIDPRGYTTNLEYIDNFKDEVNRNSFAYLTGSINAKGHSVLYKYDFDSGLIREIKDANDGVTTRTYDSKNRLTGVTAPDGGETTYSYTDQVNSLKVTKTTKIDGTLNTTRNVVEHTHFDGLGRVKKTELVDPDLQGNVFVDREYDWFCSCLGRISRVSNPYRTGETIRWTQTLYDRLDRVEFILAPDHNPQNIYVNSIRYIYSGNAVTVRDQGLKDKRYVYDALGRLTQVVEPDSTGALTLTTDYQYNVLDKMTRITQGIQSRTFAYDSLGRLTSETHPESGTKTYQYDDNGNLTQRTDARGITTSLTVDELNRLTNKAYSDAGVTPPVSYTYDTVASGKGRLARVFNGAANNPVADYSYTYDALGRTLTQSAGISGNSFNMSYRYNFAGDVIETTYPNGTPNGMLITTEYNTANRLTKVTSSVSDPDHPSTLASGISYTAAGAIRSASYGNGLSSAQTYNTNLQLKTLRVGSAIDFTYNYNETVSNTGRITSIWNNVDRTKDLNFTYDEVYRLKTAETLGTWWGLQRTYDRYGNRLSQALTKGTPPTSSLTVDPATNRVTGHSYDAAGNLIDDGVKTYQYDAENRLIRVRSAGEDIAVYEYDATGQRVVKRANSMTTLFVMGVGEYQGGVWKRVQVGVAGARVEYNGDGTMTWNHLDHLGTARAVTDKAGALVARKDYYPFGEEWTTTANNEHKFSGYYRDSEAGLDYSVHRYYAAGIARWTSADAIMPQPYLPQSLNKYGYCFNDPVNYVDPNGTFPTWGWIGGGIHIDGGSVTVTASLSQVPPIGTGSIGALY